MKILFFTLLLYFSGNAFADEVNFSGVLRHAIPCVVNGGEELIVPFYEVNDKDLYAHREVAKLFEITLSECESLPDFSFSMSFTGVSNPKIKGSLRIDGDPGDLGYAIVLTSDNGNVDINSQYPIVGMNDNKFPGVIPLKASILGEEDAIKNKSIKLGDFSATTTFNIYYE